MAEARGRECSNQRNYGRGKEAQSTNILEYACERTEGKAPSFLDTGLDLNLVANLVDEFEREDKDGWRFRYPRYTISVPPPNEPRANILQIDFEALVDDLRHAHNVLDTLDAELVNQYGENAAWESELGSM